MDGDVEQERGHLPRALVKPGCRSSRTDRE